MSETIEVTVRVPADLEVVKSHSGYKLFGPGGYGLWYADNSESWTCALGQQIAAAVEARKPKPPPLFGVGDVVEWTIPNGHTCIGIINGVDAERGSYTLNGYDYSAKLVDSYKLVRRAEK